VTDPREMAVNKTLLVVIESERLASAMDERDGSTTERFGDDDHPRDSGRGRDDERRDPARDVADADYEEVRTALRDADGVVRGRPRLHRRRGARGAALARPLPAAPAVECGRLAVVAVAVGCSGLSR
jgi:hypothetical protein